MNMKQKFLLYYNFKKIEKLNLIYKRFNLKFKKMDLIYIKMNLKYKVLINYIHMNKFLVL